MGNSNRDEAAGADGAAPSRAAVELSSLRARWLEADKVASMPLTLAIGVAGALMAFAAGLPAATLSGSVLAVACASLAGFRVGLPAGVREIALILLGAEVGSQVRPDVFRQVATLPIAFLGLGVVLCAIMWGVSFWLRQVFKFDAATARLSAVPGALPYVLAMTEPTGADQAKVAIVQLLRLLTIAAVMPLMITTFGGNARTAIVAATPPLHSGLLGLALVIGAAAAMTAVFYRFRLPVPPLFGSLTGAALVTLTGFVAVQFPVGLSAGMAIVIGAMTGTAFLGRRVRDVLAVLPAGISALALGSFIALLVAWIVAHAIGRPVAEVWLAFAPGGAETIGLIALTLGYDAAFVGVLNVGRFLALGVFVPLWVRRFLSPESSR